MTRTQKLLRLLSTALIAALVAGGVANTILSATPLQAAWPLSYLWGFGAALLGAAMCLGTPGLIAALSALTAFVGMTALGGAFGARALFESLRAFGESGDISLLGAHGPAAAMLLGVTLGLLFFLLVRRRGSLFFAAAVALMAILVACTVGENANVGAAVPALIGLAAAYAFAADTERDLKSCLRALVPTALAVLLAPLLVPQGRLTWPPLENAADFKQIPQGLHKKVATALDFTQFYQIFCSMFRFVLPRFPSMDVPLWPLSCTHTLLAKKTNRLS